MVPDPLTMEFLDQVAGFGRFGDFSQYDPDRVTSGVSIQLDR